MNITNPSPVTWTGMAKQSLQGDHQCMQSMLRINICFGIRRGNEGMNRNDGVSADG